MIRWPVGAGRAIAKLFRAIQDLDVFVEDQGDEQFYLQLLQTAAGGSLTVKRVVALGGSDAVIAAAAAYTEDRKALFLIDGDLPFVRGESAPAIPRLFRLDCYCIENILITPTPTLKICAEESVCDLSEAARKLNFIGWRNLMTALVPLFARFAVLSEVAPGNATVGEGFAKVSENDEHKLPALSPGRLAALILTLDAQLNRILGEAVATQRIEEALARLNALEDPLRSISGKDYLLPLLHFELKRASGTKVTKAVFRYRLAVNASRDDLEMLVAALDRAA